MASLVLATVLLLAFANGANDNFKGVATIYGSGTAGYRTALVWATVTTLAGAMLSFWLASDLVKVFSGEGIVDAETAALPSFPLVVSLAAGLTVLLAGALSMPISTTHAIVGALAGIALVTGSGWGWLPGLALLFFLPLLTSPLVAILLSFTANRLLPGTEGRCLCIAEAGTTSGGSLPVLVSGTNRECEVHGARALVKTSWLVNGVHFLSAGAVGFSRGLNDTPKLLGILAAGSLTTADLSTATCVGLAMALGGLLWARPIAETMGKRLTPIPPAQGAVSNILTSGLVGAASLAGLPVSTTHVSCGTIFGLGLSRRELSGRWAGGVLASWLFTLPVAAALSALFWTIG